LAVPVRVTVVRSGIPNAIPGRSLDLSEGGLAAVFAGELATGDPVGVEFLLPEMGLGLHAKAVVRHHAALRCGLEFQSLSVEQRAMIRRWTHRALAIPTPSTVDARPTAAVQKAKIGRVVSIKARFPALPNFRSRRFLASAASVLALFALLSWWQWQRGWQELEAEVVSAQSTAPKTQRITLPPGVMEPMLLSKVDPELPQGTRKASGAVLLRIVVGQDGTIIDQHPVSGSDALVRAAMDAVKYWRFQPYRINGRAVEVDTTVTVEFQ